MRDDWLESLISEPVGESSEAGWCKGADGGGEGGRLVDMAAMAVISIKNRWS